MDGSSAAPTAHCLSRLANRATGKIYKNESITSTRQLRVRKKNVSMRTFGYYSRRVLAVENAVLIDEDTSNQINYYNIWRRLPMLD